MQSRSFHAVRTFSLFLVVILTLLIVLAFSLYLLSPRLIAHFAPDVLAPLGFTEVEVRIDHPNSRTLLIEGLVLKSETLMLRAENIRLDYQLSELMAGDIAAITVPRLDLTLYTGDVKAENINESQPDLSPAQLFALAPVRKVTVESLHLQVPELGFSGQGRADMTVDALSVSMQGMTPEPASHFSVLANLTVDGEITAMFQDQARDSTDHLDLRGRIYDDRLDAQGEFRIGGYAFELASLLAGIPAGAGSMAGHFMVQLPWPLTEVPDWQGLDADLNDVKLLWTSADDSLTLDLSSSSAGLKHGKIDAKVTGAIHGIFNGFNVSIVFPQRYQLHYDTATLSGGKGAQLLIEDGKVSAAARSRSFALQATPARLEIDADVVTRGAGLSIDGRITAKAGAENFATFTSDMRGSVGFAGVVQMEKYTRPASMNLAYTIHEQVLMAQGSAASSPFSDIPLDARYEMATGAGRFQATNTSNITKPLMATLIDGWAEDYDFDGGAIESSITLSWQTLDKVTGDVSLSVRDGNVHYAAYVASGISGLFELKSEDLSSSNWVLDPTELIIASLDVGLPINDMRLTLSWFGDQMNFTSANADLLGGQAITNPFDYSIENGTGAFDLTLTNIDLAAVLALEGDDISGTGRLNGNLPVTISNNEVSVRGGRVSALAPGGEIRLSPSLAGVTGQAGLDFALNALQDFSYSMLNADVDYAANGDLALAVQLHGSNPAVEKGRPIQYNLKITENVPVLLESLRLQDDMTRRIEKRVREK